MKTTKILSLLAIFAMCTLTSCFGDSEDSHTSTSSLGNLFNAVIGDNPDDVTLYNNVSYQIQWDYVNNVANVTATGIRLPDQSNLPSIQINSIPVKTLTNGWINANITDYTPSNYTGNLLFNFFSLKVGPSSFCISYRINDKYTVYSYPQLFGVQGKTKITNLNTGTSFDYSGDQKPTYYISLDPSTKKGFIVIANAKFTENASTSNIKLPLLPFDARSTVSMRAEESKPATLSAINDMASINSAGTPIENAKATNISMYFNPETHTTISFDYTIDNGDVQERYRYEFSVEYNNSSSSLQSL